MNQSLDLSPPRLKIISSRVFAIILTDLCKVAIRPSSGQLPSFIYPLLLQRALLTLFDLGERISSVLPKFLF